MDARTDLRLVEIRERTAAAGHRLRDNLRLHLSDRTEGRGFVALSDASPQTPSPASRPISHVPNYGDVINSKADEIAPPKLAVDGEVEHRQIAFVALDLKPD